MIRQVKIQNFRCFSSAEIDDLQRINIVVGKNASGKTAFLESIFIASSTTAPQIAFNLRNFRQMGSTLQIPSEPTGFVGLWADLFHWFNEERQVTIDIFGSEGDSRSLRVFFSGYSEQTLEIGKQPVSPVVAPQINFEWKRDGSPPILIKPRQTTTGLSLEVTKVEYFPVLMFGPKISDPPEETARRYSQLSKVGKADQIAGVLKTEFPIIDSLGIEFSAASPMVFASVSGKPVKLPVGLVSDGINRLLSILVGIATFPNGVLLVDQIEDGFYWQRLPSIWKILYRFAKDNNVQIVATTHSLEALNALAPAIRENADDFALLKVEREDGSSRIKTVKGKFFDAALEQGFDVR